MISNPSPTRTPRYVLTTTAHEASPPMLDADQQRVLDHPGGPMLVLAGPGTGKTTTLVEAIVERIERRGVDPRQIVALTFSRKAAEQLRDRVTARLGRTMTTPIAATFHSFAYGLIREFAPQDLYQAPLRLLSAPEADVIMRELMAAHPESVQWPERLRRAVGTRGFAHEVQAVLARAREKGIDGDRLREIGIREGIEEWAAAGYFLEHYLTNLDAQSALDYPDVIRRAQIEAHVHREELRARYRHVFVDEYQDTDPGQVALLASLAGAGGNLIVVGDPHQSIYAFRGAQVRGIMDFPRDFPCPDGRPADVVALRTTRRFGDRLLAASQRIAGRLGLPGHLPEAARRAFAEPHSGVSWQGPGRVEVWTVDTERAEAEHVADLLRRAHLEDGITWDQMAILVRSGRARIPGLRRSLAAAGVPVEVAADDGPLAEDPAVLPLLDALRAVVHGDLDDPEHVDYLDPRRVASLLVGPLGGMDAGGVRRLARQLRAHDKEHAGAQARPALTSPELLRRVLTVPGSLEGFEGPDAERARALVALLEKARSVLRAGGGAEEVLWTLWSGTQWPARLRRQSEAGGAAARRAHRDLDAIVAVFDQAARTGERRDHAGVRAFMDTLAAQQIPGDTLADRGVRGAAVRLLTAHRSKGLEWPLVVVAHVQHDGWPDLRRRARLLRADRLAADGVQPPVSSRELLADERRLFYVACTRAQQRLVVTAVAASDEEGDQPSRFLDELGVEVRHRVGRPQRSLSLAGLVAELRRTVADPASEPPLVEAAARRLALLAREEGRGGRALVPAADPATWWGTRAATVSSVALRDPGAPVSVSASMLEHLMLCPTQWFLQQEAGGVASAHQSANLGQIVHALADRVAIGDICAGPDDADVLMAHVDEVWDRLAFRTPWSRALEHKRVRAALARFLVWHHTNRRDLIGTEEGFAARVELPSGEQAALVGYADRIELAADGSVVVVDLKTGRTPPANSSVQRNRQLALYQYAVDSGALSGRAQHAPAGGAELIQLGMLDDRPAIVQVQDPQPQEGAARAGLRAELDSATAMVRAEEFPAIPGQHCLRCAFIAICPAKSAGSVIAQ